MHAQTAAIVHLLTRASVDSIDAEAMRAAIEQAEDRGKRRQVDPAAAREAWWRATQTARDSFRRMMLAEAHPEACNDFRRVVSRSRGR